MLKKVVSCTEAHPASSAAGSDLDDFKGSRLSVVVMTESWQVPLCSCLSARILLVPCAISSTLAVKVRKVKLRKVHLG